LHPESVEFLKNLCKKENRPELDIPEGDDKSQAI